MANTVIDPTTLIGATTSDWAELAQSTITFTRVLTETTDPNTGNLTPLDTETLTVPAYFKRFILVQNEGRGVRDDGIGVPIGSYRVDGYTVGILPDWAKVPTAPRLPCTINNLGSGYFYFQGRIHVVKDEVEQDGGGSQIQGYFTMQGSN